MLCYHLLSIQNARSNSKSVEQEVLERVRERISSSVTEVCAKSVYHGVHAELGARDILETLIGNGVNLGAKTIKGNIAIDEALG